MKIIELTCPNCGEKLHKEAYDLLRCSSCQSEFIIKEEADDAYLVSEYNHEPLTDYKPLPPAPRKILSTLLIVFVVAILVISLLIYLIVSKETHLSAGKIVTFIFSFTHIM